MYIGNIGSAHLFAFGNAGVDFFFVLSGFIIYYVHHSDINQPNRVGRYLFRRFTLHLPDLLGRHGIGDYDSGGKAGLGGILTVPHLPCLEFCWIPQAQLAHNRCRLDAVA